MRSLYPRTKFVDMNSIQRQIEHLIGETKELLEAYGLYGHYKFNKQDCDKAAQYLQEIGMESQDIAQSAATLLYIIDQMFPGLNVWGYREKMIEKNQVRDYYAHQQTPTARVEE